MTTFLKPGVSPGPNQIFYTTEMPGKDRCDPAVTADLKV